MSEDAGGRIRLVLDPRLVEEAVRLEMGRREVAGDRSASERYHRQADLLYERPGDRREAAFVALHRRLFTELGLEDRIVQILSGHRDVLEGLDSLTCLRALAMEDEGADLDPPAGDGRGRAGVIRLTTGRLLDPDSLVPLMDHELVHLGDLLSPAFGHDPEALLAVPPHRRRLIQARYRTLWAASVDGRLERRGRRPLAHPHRHLEAIRRGFPGLGAAAGEQLLARLWREDRPTHAGLMAIAAGREAREPHQPGAPCPLCLFPTHQWVDTIDHRLVGAIRIDVPGWAPEDGLCDRCFEMYEMRSQTQV